MSLRLRLTLWYATALAVVLLAYGAVVYLTMRHALLAGSGPQSEYLRHELEELLFVLLAGLPVGVGVAGLGGWLLARRALAPVGRMADQARRITADRLSERLPVEDPNDEIGRLATVVNDTLARLERSFGGLRRFTSDAAHELRTPLTAIRAVGEEGLAAAREPSAYRDIVGSMLEEVDRLKRLVDSLLTLSRADAGESVASRERLDAAAIAREVADQLEVLASEREQRIVVDAPGTAPVTADAGLIRTALMNLVDNAIRHGPAPGRILLRVRAAAAGTAIEVLDEGPGIPSGDRERVFERFARLDAGRSRAEGGTGLGLPIARWAVEQCGGRLDLAEDDGSGTMFRVVLG